MKTLNRHIAALLGVLALASCSLDELHLPDQGREVEFIMRPTSFSGIDVASASTKALSADQLTEVEGRIASLYFLVFGEDGNRLEDLSGALDPASAVSRTLYGRGPLTVCYIANVPYSYVSQLTHIDRLQDTPLPITYASHSQTGHVGVPDMTLDLDRNGTDESKVQCFPMFGQVTFPGAESVDNQVEVPLQRLFAKVIVRLRTQFDTDWGSLFDAPEINLYSYTLNNLPTNIMLSDESITDSQWVSYENTQNGRKYFEDPVEFDMDDITVNNNLILQTYTTVLTCYVPEYYLSPKTTAASNQDQRLKPQMYDSSKRPVYLTINGHTHQSNFVDVPLKYHIYFGENAVNNFNLLRNCQYNYNMTITGTGDAILGEDERVEALYHNLANPDNSGTDVPANCYIISKPGRYMIPTYIGNKVTGGTQIGGASVDAAVHLSGDTATDKVTNIRFLPTDHADNTLGQDCIMFDVNMYDSNNAFSPADVVGSNKLICLKNSSGQIIWSWHLWLCEDGNRPDTEGYLNTYPTTGAIVMNRALGATNHQGIEALEYSLAYWDDGLYYQWGRKDPLLPTGNTTASAATYAKAKQNPRIFYTDWKGTYTAENNTDAVGWTSSKSVNDPCPPGYKVPSTQIWRTSGNSSTGLEDIMETLGLDGYPYNLQSNGGLSVNIVYPYSSYLDISGSKMIYEKKPLKDSNGNTTLYSAVRTINLLLGKYDLRLKYSGTSTIILLRLWGSSCSLYYDTEEFAIDETNIVVQYKRSTASSYGEINLSSLASIPLIGNSLVSYAADLLGELKEPKVNYKVEKPIPASVLSHGAHVRCVREDSPVQ